ncbi:hypothetical protein GCM10010218_05670 [Streptomyces mashuensis]|uniref:Phage or prophage related protein n=1 Tax=Streptomyces mashuensis TaxID=33904 RepID=A0A919AUZ5_9ACTN|nr:hypothetical protein [Streptomyces mashuensis]GHF27554.1 hypothetical protein GCM10010218_05670 [Streptomyces mashuensis]
MARIRTIKPEAFVSESLAACTVTAERTFFGLLTQADDHGRHRDHPAIIAGKLWPLRPEHTPLDVEDDLQQLASAGLICRYTGCDGRGYLHIVAWAKHQKIDRPSASRLPLCSAHDQDKRCGACKAECGHTPRPDHAPTPSVRVVEDSVNTPRALVEPSTNVRRVLASPEQPSPPKTAPSPTLADTPAPSDGHLEAATSTVDEENAGQSTFDEDSSNSRRGLDEPSPSGSRILDPGSIPSGRTAPPPSTVSAKTLIGEYIAACAHRPPERVLGHLGRELNQLLGEGIATEHLRAALERLRAKGLSPSVLPSLVNEVMNATARHAPSGVGGGYSPWMNPADDSAYEEAL